MGLGGASVMTNKFVIEMTDEFRTGAKVFYGKQCGTLQDPLAYSLEYYWGKYIESYGLI